MFGPRVEACNPVFDRVAGREHQDGHAGACRAQLPADCEPVFARQHDIEDDQVVVIEVGPLQRFLAVHHDINSVSVFAQPFGEHLGGARFIFNQKNTHFPTPVS